MHRAILCSAAALALFACAEPGPPPGRAPEGGQSYEEAIALICNVDQAARIEADASVLDVAERRHDFLQERVKNPDGIYFYTIFRTQGPREQAASLRSEVREHRLKGCALADALERDDG
jgi:hypothetical protein